MGIKGSCQCGSSRYATSEAPVFAAFCHCASCQKGGGGGHSVNVAVPAAGLATEGPVRSYAWKGGSGASMSRSFCGTCGSPLLIEAEAIPGLALLQAGTIDEGAAVEGAIHIFCASAQPWDPIPEGAPSFPAGPPAAT